MKLLNIKLAIIFACFFAIGIGTVSAGEIPLKIACVVNENGQPLLHADGSGMIVSLNNASGTIWSLRAGADGCATFQDADAYEYDKNKTVKYSDEASGPRELHAAGNGDIGCASGPFGMKVTLPEKWQEQWECQTIGSANGPFPCCRNDKGLDGACTNCSVHGTWNGTEYVGAYSDEVPSNQRQCFCTRSFSGKEHEGDTAKDQNCPLCFHNNGNNVKAKLVCKKKKTAESVSLENPQKSQFSPPAGQAVDCLGSRVCAYEAAPAEEGKEGEESQDSAPNCTVKNTSDSGKRRFMLEHYREQALKYTEVDADGHSLKSPVFITECIMEGTNESDATYVCTTGSAAMDTVAGLTRNGTPTFTYLNQTYGYQAKIFDENGEAVVQKTLRDADNNIVDKESAGTTLIANGLKDIAVLRDIYEWETTTTEPVRSVHAIFYDEKYSQSTESGDNPTQVQRTLKFIGECTLHIDPIGRVFDNHTLEPIPGVNMSLENANTKQKLNSQITKADGMFSFYVNPGTYRLIPQLSSYIFPVDTIINPKAENLYRNLYTGGDITVEKAIVYTDVPIQPSNKQQAELKASQTAPTFIEYFQSINKSSNEYVVQGRVSHSKARVNVYTDVANPFNNGEMNPGRIIAGINADDYGRFKVTFPLEKMNQNETVGMLEVVKPKELYVFGGGLKSSVQLNPLLNSVKGFAYDSKGDVMSGATITVKIPVFEKPIYQLSADEKGYFEIPSEKLPPLPYTLTFTSLSNKEEVVNTRTFIAQNAETNTNLSRYYAARPDSLLQQVLGETTDYSESMNPSGDNFFDENKPAVMLGLFVFMLITAIPLYNLYSKNERKHHR